MLGLTGALGAGLVAGKPLQAGAEEENVAYAVANDFLSIQAALDSLGDAAGTVKVPAGLYYKSEVGGELMPPIRLKSNQRLEGAGGTLSKLFALRGGNIIESVDCNNMEIDGLYLKAYVVDNETDPDATIRGIAFWGAQNSSITNCRLENFRHGPAIAVSGEVWGSTRFAQNVIVDSNHVSGTYKHSGISLYQFVRRCTISNNQIDGCDFAGILLDNDADFNLVENNAITDCGFNPTPSSYPGIVCDNAAHNEIKSNVIIGCAKDGISIGASGQLDNVAPKAWKNKIIGNTVWNCVEHGIRIRGNSNGGGVSDNTVYAAANVVDNNECIGNGGEPVHQSLAKGTVLNGNSWQ